MSLVLYTLYALSFFTGITGLIAILINHVKYRDASKTLYGSHFRWQMRTFWFSVLWWAVLLVAWGTSKLVGGLAAPALAAMALLLVIVNPVWVVYRIIRGALACIDGRRMPV